MAQYYMELRQNAKNLLLWGICQAGLLIMGYVEFLFVFHGNADVAQIMTELPPALSALFGLGRGTDFSTMQGFYVILVDFVFYVLAAYAGFLGVRIFTREATGKTADFLFSKPISRRRVFGVKYAAGATLCVSLTLMTLLISLVTFGTANLVVAVLVAAVTSLLMQIVYFSAGAMFASVCASPDKAGGWNLLFLMTSILSGKLFNMAGISGPVMALSGRDYFPMDRYFSTGGFGAWPWLVSLALIGLFLVVSIRTLQRRDL